MEERHVMRRPGQVVPGSIAGRPHASGASPTAAARVAPDAARLNPNHQPAARFFLHHHHGDPTCPPLASSKSRENTTQLYRRSERTVERRTHTLPVTPQRGRSASPRVTLEPVNAAAHRPV